MSNVFYHKGHHFPHKTYVAFSTTPLAEGHRQMLYLSSNDSISVNLTESRLGHSDQWNRWACTSARHSPLFQRPSDMGCRPDYNSYGSHQWEASPRNRHWMRWADHLRRARHLRHHFVGGVLAQIRPSSRTKPSWNFPTGHRTAVPSFWTMRRLELRLHITLRRRGLSRLTHSTRLTIDYGADGDTSDLREDSTLCPSRRSLQTKPRRPTG